MKESQNVKIGPAEGRRQKSRDAYEQTALTAGIIESALAADFGIRIDELTRLGTEEAGDNSEVFTGQYEGQKVFVKLERRVHPYEIEAAAFELLKEHGIPCPRVIALQGNPAHSGRPTIIETAASGTSLGQIAKESRSTASLWEKAGKILRQINSIPMKRWGGLSMKSGTLAGTVDSWGAHLSTIQRDIDYARDHGFIDVSECQKAGAILARLSAMNIQQPFLLHGDFQQTHVFSDGQEITGIIDFGAAKAGDPLWDAAYANFFLAGEDRPAFNQGYGELASGARIAEYLLLISITKIAYRHKRGFETRLPAALAILRESVSALTAAGQ